MHGAGARSDPGPSFDILCAAVARHTGDEPTGFIPLFSYQLPDAFRVVPPAANALVFPKDTRGPTRFCCFLLPVLPSLPKTGIMVFGSVSPFILGSGSRSSGVRL
jgi:hypothetical protein